MVVGYLAGESYESVSRYLGKATGAVLILLVSIVVIVLVGRWLGRNPDPARALAARAAALPPLRWLTQRYGVLFFLLSMHIGTGWALLLNLAAGLALLFVIGLGLSWLMGSSCGRAGCRWSTTASRPGSPSGARTASSTSRPRWSPPFAARS